MKAIMMTAVSLIVSVVTCNAKLPEGAQVDPQVHTWFEAQSNMRQQHCCRLADGHILEDDEWRITSTGDKYEVRIEGVWTIVEPWMMRDAEHGGPNITGKAIAWWFIDTHTGKAAILCFAPGFGG